MSISASDGAVMNAARDEYFAADKQLTANLEAVTAKISTLKSSLPQSTGQADYDAIIALFSTTVLATNLNVVTPAMLRVTLAWGNLAPSTQVSTRSAYLDPVNEMYNANLSAVQHVSMVLLPELLSAVAGTPYSDTSLTSGVAAIQDKSAFSVAYASMAATATQIAAMPAALAGSLTALQNDMKAKVDSAISNLGRDMSIARTSMNLQNKLSFTSTGKPASDSVLASALGPMAVLLQGPKLLADQAASISSAAISFTATSGLSMESITSFATTVPAQFYANLEINPDYTAFVADPANAANVSILSNLTSTMSTIASTASNALTAAEGAASSALSSAIADIKSLSLAALITSPMPPAMTLALNQTVDYAKIAVPNIQNALSIGPPRILNVQPGETKLAGINLDAGTKDADLTYTGDDQIVWNRVNTERLRRGLPGLTPIGVVIT